MKSPIVVIPVANQTRRSVCNQKVEAFQSSDFRNSDLIGLYTTTTTTTTTIYIYISSVYCCCCRPCYTNIQQL